MLFQAAEEHTVKDEIFLNTTDFMCFNTDSGPHSSQQIYAKAEDLPFLLIFPEKYYTITQIITISLRMEVHKNAIRHL
jgi:hypothetical protein